MFVPQVQSPRWCYVAAVVLVSLLGCGRAPSREIITVSYAASMTDAMAELGRDLQARHPEIELRTNVGASGDLARQIEQGAPVDVFISAGEKELRQLEDRGRIDQRSEFNLAANRLVLIGPPDSKLSGWKDLASVRRLAIGAPSTVPAGRYAKATLDHRHILAPQVECQNVRQVLTLVERGDADAGFVYATDAIGHRVKVLATAIPGEDHPPIVYPVAATAGRTAAAQPLLQELRSPTMKAILRRLGFATP